MYVRKIDDQLLTLQVSGKLWMRSLVMNDVETKSEWAHLLGRAMAGPMNGKVLKPLVTDMVTWKTWKQLHPQTTVLKMSRTHRDYNRQFYKDTRRFVFGFHVGDRHFALPMSELKKYPVWSFEANSKPLLATFDDSGAVTHLFDRVMDGHVMDFKKTPTGSLSDDRTGSTWNLLTGRCESGELKGRMLKQRVGIMSFRKTWQDFHPDSVDIAF